MARAHRQGASAILPAALMVCLSFLAGCDGLKGHGPPDRSLKITVSSFKTAAKYPAYLGDGPALSAPPGAVSGDGMSGLIMQNDSSGQGHTYLAGETEAPSGGVLLVVAIDSKNVSATDHEFQPLDVGVEGGTLDALGAGDMPFAKGAAAWDQVRSSARTALPSGGDGHYVYVFAMPKANSTWKLTYRGNQVAILR